MLYPLSYGGGVGAIQLRLNWSINQLINQLINESIILASKQHHTKLASFHFSNVVENCHKGISNTQQAATLIGERLLKF
jgi:hypothetical protein